MIKKWKEKFKKNIVQVIDYGTLSSGESRQSVFLLFLCKLSVVFLAVLSTVSWFASSYKLGGDLFGIALVGLFLIILFTVLIQSKRTMLLGAALLLLWGSLGGFKSSYLFIKNTGILAYNYALYILKNLNYFVFDYTVDMDSIVRSEELFNKMSNHILTLIMVILSVVFALLLMKRMYVIPATAVACIFIIPGLFIDCYPGAFQLGLLLISFVALYIMKRYDSFYKNAREPKKIPVKSIFELNYERVFKRISKFSQSCVAGVTAAVICFAAFSSATLLVGKSEGLDVTPVRETFENIRYYFDSWMMGDTNLTLGIFGNLGGHGNTSLTDAYYYGYDIMKVKSITGKTIYLRGWIGQDYSKGKWNPVTKKSEETLGSLYERGFDPDRLMYDFYKKTLSLALQNTTFKNNLDTKYGYLYDQVEIQVGDVLSDILFLPSLTYSFPSPLKMGTVQYDKMIKVDFGKYKGSTYSADVMIPYYDKDFPDISKRLISEYVSYYSNELEREYAGFVKENYTKLPEGISQQYSSLADSFIKSPTPLFEEVRALSDYIGSHYNYSLTPKKPQDTKSVDPVEYVMFDSKEGFCTHYASALVFLLRSKGIPARYVEGYVAKESAAVKTKAGFTTTVRDENAHAWVEVYFDGIGWLTFDPTPGFSGGMYGPDISEPGPAPGTPDASSSAASSSSSATVSQNTPSRASQSPQSQDQTSKENLFPTGSAASGSQAGTSGGSWLQRLLIILLFILLSFSLVGAVLWIQKLYERQLHKLAALPPEKAVPKAYRMILLMLREDGLIPGNEEIYEDFAKRVSKKYETDAAALFAFFMQQEFSGIPATQKEKENALGFAEGFVSSYEQDKNYAKQLILKCKLFFPFHKVIR